MSNMELAETVVRLARKRGADEVEALVISQQEKAVNAFNQQVRLSGDSDTTRITVRLFRDNRGALAIGRGCSELMLGEMIDRALASLRHSAPDKFLGSVDAKHFGRIDDDLKIFDERLSALSLTRMGEIALAAEAAVAQKDSRLASQITSSFQVQKQNVALSTSHGFNESYESTTGTLLTSVVAGDYSNESAARGSQGDEGRLAGGASIITHSLDYLDFEKTASRTIKHLSAMVGARPSPAGWFPVVLAPTAARRIAQMFLQICSGPIVMLMKGSTMGKIGEQICSPLITLVDDATRVGGLRTAPFDHEGVRPRRQLIIEEGIFREYLLNNYYARALERDSTGNASANNEIRFTVRPSNAYIEPGKTSAASIISDIKQGFYINMFVSPNSQLQPLAANFVQAATGFWIEDGKLTYPVRVATITAPLREMLNNIAAVGDDLDTDTAVVSPTLLLSKMNVSPLL